MLIEYIMLGTFCAGIMVIYSAEIKAAGSYIKNTAVLRLKGFKTAEGGFDMSEQISAYSGVNEAVLRMLQITFDLGSQKSVTLFWILSVGFPIPLFLFLTSRINPGIAAVTAVFTASLPSLMMLLKLQTMRIGSSKEGEVLLTELIDNYRINYFNMQEAIEVTAITIEEAPNCKKLLLNLSKGLNRVSGNEEIKKLLYDFKFAIGTSWAGVLTDNIYFALSSGIKVTAAMEDLLATVSRAKEVAEYAKRENNESTLILKYLAPACYILTVLGGIKFFGLSFREFMQYQFATSTGLSWFMASLLTYGASLIAKGFLSRTKLDL